MSYKQQSTFSTGELDPVLGERMTLAKYKASLRTGRNVVVGRAGNVITRPSRTNLFQTKTDNSPVKIYCVPKQRVILEFGVGYVRGYNKVSGILMYDVVTDYTSSDLTFLQFETSGNFVYGFVANKAMKKFNWSLGTFVTNPFALPTTPIALANVATGVPTGYFVDYGFSYIINGEESPIFELFGAFLNIKVPIANGQSQVLTGNIASVTGSAANLPQGVTETRWYRRPVSYTNVGVPVGGGAYGYIGSSNVLYTLTSGPNFILQSVFTDLGGAADYTKGPPTLVTRAQHPTGPADLLPQTGVVYQQRLILGDFTFQEPIWASRPGFQNNFTRNYPLDSDSALNFKSASSGTAAVLRFIDSYGLVVFTTQGVFVNSGPISPTTLSLEKKGKWVIDSKVQPIAVPGGVLFVDVATNSVRSLNWSTEMGGYTAEDVGIYSGHLFRKNKITSWGFQEGILPLLFVSFEDGTFASFTYEFEQDMRAWTRHDSNIDSTLFIEQICETGDADNTLFLVRKGTTRYVEMTIPRYVPALIIANNPQASMNASVAKMDSMTTYDGLLNGSFQVQPQVPDEWNGLLVLTCGSAGLFTIASGRGVVGAMYRKFNDDDGTSIDLEVIQHVDDNTLIVEPNIEYPEDESLFSRIYKCTQTITGLARLEGEYVGLVIDGRVVSSPLNDIDNYPDVYVESGAITFPQGKWGAIVHVGRVFASDTETNDVDTIEEKPTYIESKTVNKLYIKTKDSNGLFVGSKFRSDDKLEGMTEIDEYEVDYSQDEPIVGNRAKPPETKRFEITLPGDWKSNGRVCIRSVDPLHSEILSIVPDAEVLWRSDQ